MALAKSRAPKCKEEFGRERKPSWMVKDLGCLSVQKGVFAVSVLGWPMGVRTRKAARAAELGSASARLGAALPGSAPGTDPAPSLGCCSAAATPCRVWPMMQKLVLVAALRWRFPDVLRSGDSW